MARLRNLNLGFSNYSSVYLWLLFVAVFGIWTPETFLTTTTVHTVASEQAIAAMLGIAVLIPLVAGSFDLSVGATANLSGIVAVTLLEESGWPLVPSILVSIGVAAFVGVFNGFLIVKMKVNSFIATLGSSAIIAAVQSITSGQLQPAPPQSQAWEDLTHTSVLGFEIVVGYLLVIAVAAWWLLDRTPMGRYLYAIGGSAEAARLSGVDVGKWVWIAHICSATVAGFAGVMYTSHSGPSLTFGAALLLPAFASVFLGSTQVRPGRFNMWGALLAVYVLATGVKGLQLVTGLQWLNDMFNGTALICAVAFAAWRQSATRRPVARKAVPASDEPDPAVAKT